MWHCHLHLPSLNWFVKEAVDEFIVTPSDEILISEETAFNVTQKVELSKLQTEQKHFEAAELDKERRLELKHFEL